MAYPGPKGGHERQYARKPGSCLGVRYQEQAVAGPVSYSYPSVRTIGPELDGLPGGTLVTAHEVPRQRKDIGAIYNIIVRVTILE